MQWDKKTKEVISYLFALLALIVGFGLTIAGFIVSPLGEIHTSVQWVLGQCLVFAGSVCGIALYVNNSMQTMKNELKRELNK